MLVAWALILATMPRWEVHAHAAGEHDHAFAELHAAHHAEAEASAQGDELPVAPHAHQVVSVTAALPSVEPLPFAQLPPESWPGPRRGRPPAPSPRVPPQRPPIA